VTLGQVVPHCPWILRRMSSVLVGLGGITSTVHCWAKPKNPKTKPVKTMRYPLRMIITSFSTGVTQIYTRGCRKVLRTLIMPNYEHVLNTSVSTILLCRTMRLDYGNVRIDHMPQALRRSLGSKRSRIPSPRRLNPKMARKMANPGKVETHHWPGR